MILNTQNYEIIGCLDLAFIIKRPCRSSKTDLDKSKCLCCCDNDTLCSHQCIDTRSLRQYLCIQTHHRTPLPLHIRQCLKLKMLIPVESFIHIPGWKILLILQDLRRNFTRTCKNLLRNLPRHLPRHLPRRILKHLPRHLSRKLTRSLPRFLPRFFSCQDVLLRHLIKVLTKILLRCYKINKLVSSGMEQSLPLHVGCCSSSE